MMTAEPEVVERLSHVMGCEIDTPKNAAVIDGKVSLSENVRLMGVLFVVAKPNRITLSPPAGVVALIEAAASVPPCKL
jgi:hypothetical protein